MNVETEEIEYCKLRIKYTADPETVKEKQDEAVAELRKLPVPGFRPGKAPDYAIKARCKSRIKDYVAREMATEAFEDAIYEKKIKPLGNPQVEKINLKDSNFSCEMVILKKPDIELQEYKGLEIPKPHMDRDVDAQVQKTLQDLRMQFGDIAPYQENDFVEMGDQITMDFEAVIDGKSFDGSTAEGALYTIGENRWPGFDDNLLGMSPGEEREFDLEFPDGLSVIGGKIAHFKVLVHMGTKRVPCALDDELAQKVGLNNFDEVRQKIATIANDRIRQTELSLIRQQVGNRLIEAHDFKVPDWLLDAEGQQVAAQSQVVWSELSDEEKSVFKEQGEKHIKLSLLLDEIRDEEPEAVLSDSEALESIKKQVASQGANPEQFLVENQKSGRLHSLVSSLKDEFTLQWLVDKAKVIEA